MSVSRYFVLDQLQIELISPSVDTADQLVNFFLQSFAFTTVAQSTKDGQANGGLRTIVLIFAPVGTSTKPSHPPEAIYTAPDLTVWSANYGFLLGCGRSWLVVNTRECCGWGELDSSFTQMRLQDQRDFFLLALLMLAHGNGYFGLHANGLADRGKGYLVIGPSGSGKSTLTVQLIEQGWAYSGDDVLLLHGGCGSSTDNRTPIQAWALRREFALSTTTLRHSHHLVIEQPGVACGEKRIVSPVPRYDTQWLPMVQPALLLFAAIADAATTRLEAIEPSTALIALAQQSAGIMTNKTIAQTQFQALARLVEGAACYRLMLGRDLFTNPTQVAQLLQSL